MISIIFPYRNRDLQRLKNSLDSLQNQTNTTFEVFFVDYGSEGGIARTVEELVRGYEFADYKFYPTQDQPWNKSRALNSVIKTLTTDFCFVADVDMIFSPVFIEKAENLKNAHKAYYFQTGFLDSKETSKNREFDYYRKYRKSNDEVTGLTLFPVKAIKELRGFDEFYHFWGAEDTDMHIRLKNAGYEVIFYDKEILMLHQWHQSFRQLEQNKLSQELQIKGVVQLNHEHLKFARQFKDVEVNLHSWGECLTEEELQTLKNRDFDIRLSNKREEIRNFLYGQLPTYKGKILQLTITPDPFFKSLKYNVKKTLKKNVPEYYSMKEINDLVLTHLISFYRDNAYTYKVDEEDQKIEVGLKL